MFSVVTNIFRARGGIDVPHEDPYEYPNYFEQWNKTDLCEKLTSGNYAYLIIYVEKPTMMQLIKDIKLTVEDKMGIFGGTIGVFTGITFITIIEFCYWIIVTIYDKLTSLNTHRKKYAWRKNNKVINISPPKSGK